jgi:hypothetical protein
MDVLIEGLLGTRGHLGYFYLTDRPETAKWLTSDEKAALSQAVATEQLISRRTIRFSFGDGRCWHAVFC